MAFNPKDHLMTLNGKQYLQVAWRIMWMREEHPDWSVETECQFWDDKRAQFKATVKDGTGRTIAQAHGNETVSDFRDYFEKAETKAIGRALAISGYGTQFTTDLDEGERIVDAPVQAIKPTRPSADARPAPPKPAAAASSSPQPPSLEHALSYVPFRKGANAGRPMDDLSDESLRWILGSEKSGAQVKLMADLVLKGRAQRSQAGAGAVAKHSA